jgi:hypothetical protein
MTITGSLSINPPHSGFIVVAALRLHFGHQRRLFLRRPLPAALNNDLAIHSNRPEGPSFPHRARPDHTPQDGSDRTLTLKLLITPYSPALSDALALARISPDGLGRHPTRPFLLRDGKVGRSIEFKLYC